LSCPGDRPARSGGYIAADTSPWPRLAAIELRRRLNSVNRGIKRLADEHGLLVADLELLFHGHGVTSSDPWFVQVIEPNLAGATATAEHWHDLLTSSG
jgi:hypothetical protein